MPNAFTNPPSLPDAANAEVGDRIGSREFDRLAGLSNWLLANLRFNHTAGQGWPDGQCSDNTAVRKTNVARWRLPVLPGQASWTVRIWAAASGGAGDPGEVRFTSTNSAATLTLNPNAAGAAWYTGTLTTSTGSGYDTITMDLTGYTTTSGICTVYEVDIRPTALTTPLATSAIGDATPLGASTLDDDDALPAWVGHALRANVQTMRDDYPRPVMFWSALNGLTASTGTPNTSMPAYLHQWWVLANPGAAGRGKATAKVHAYCNPDGVSDEHVRLAPAEGGGAGEEVVTVTGGAALGWFTGEFSPVEVGPTRSAALPYQHHRFRVRPGDAADGRTDAEVRALCAWME